jgi:hypothetical protein
MNMRNPSGAEVKCTASHGTIEKQHMKQDATFFGDREAVLVYIAKRLPDALRLETALTEGGVDYGVQVEEYMGGVIFRRARAGAFFYVLPESLEAAHRVMRSHGYKPHEDQH